MIDPCVPLPILAVLHPAVWVNFLFVLQTCAWTVWAVAIFTGPQSQVGAGAWRWFGTGALLKMLAIAAVSFLSQATAIDREWLRDAVYPAFSLAAVICWARHAWKAGGGRRGDAAFLCLISGYTVVATLALARWSWDAWPWVAGAPVLAAGLWLATRRTQPSAWLRGAYAGWGLLGLIEWAGPATVFSWYANFTADLAPTWDNHAEWFAPDAQLFHGGQLFMAVGADTLGLFAGSALVVWAAFFCWWRWLGRGEAEGEAFAWVVPVATALFTLAGFFIYNVSMVKAAGVVHHEVSTRTASLASLLHQGMTTVETRRLLAPHADIGLWQLVTLRGDVIRAVSAPEIPEVEGLPLPSGVRGPASRMEATWWGPLRVDGRMYFYSVTPISGTPEEGEHKWLLLRQDYDYGGYYRRPLAASAGAVVALGGLAGAFMLAFWTRRERELRQRGARARAEEGERLQTELLATLSHDVRTPLQSLLAYGDLLAGTSLDERQAGYLHALREQANGLKHLWGNLLHLGMAGLRPESGDSAFSLSGLFAELCGAGEVLADKRGLRFESSAAPELPVRVRGDEVRLRQVLINLLHNAVNYTERGWVRLGMRLEAWDELAPDRAWVLFVVEDSGEGMSEENCARLQGLPRGRPGDSRGFGLGLPLVGKLTLLMGGAVVARGRPGAGSRVEVRLPFQVEEADQETPESAVGMPRVRHVLLVEDHAEAGAALAESLRRHGLDVARARTLAEARDLWDGRRFDAAIIDGSLPDGSGLELVRVWKKNGDGRAVLLGLSATSGDDARSSWLEAGADDLIAKPAEPAELVRRLGRVPRRDVAANPSPGEPPDWQEELADIRRGLRERDADMIGRIHYLRTSALLRGAGAVADVLAKMERELRAGNRDEAEALIRGLADGADHARPETGTPG